MTSYVTAWTYCSAAFLLGLSLFLYGFADEVSKAPVRVEELGETEDGAGYVYRKPGRQAASREYELCLQGGEALLFRSAACRDRVALLRFRNSVNTTGWSFLEVETSAQHEPTRQAYAAGYLEGAVTRKLIQHHLRNVVEPYCVGREAYCKKLEAFIRENQAWTRRHLAKVDATDPYYQSISRTYHRLQGVIDGFERRRVSFRADFEYHPIVFLNWLGEFYDLEVKFNGTRANAELPEKCSALVKLAPNNEDLFFSHVTMFAYNTMLRVAKLYKFGYDRATSPGFGVSMSSYPGVLASQDDFHLTSAKLAVMETTIGVYDKTLMEHTQAHGQFPCWLRSLVASELAATAPEWASVFLRHHMGTYNNQWMIVDYKKFTPGKPLQKGTFHVLETMPGFWVEKDKSEELQRTTFHASYNLPQFQEIVEYSNLENFALTHDKRTNSSEAIGANYYRPFKSPRARILQRDQAKATDFEKFTAVLRSNDFRREALARCACSPPFTAEAAVSSRGDLNDPHGEYEFPAMGHRNHGATDFKAVNYERVEEFSFRGWAAPTFNAENGIPPFSWSEFEARSPIRSPHHGHPDKFDFDFVEMDWTTNIWA